MKNLFSIWVITVFAIGLVFSIVDARPDRTTQKEDNIEVSWCKRAFSTDNLVNIEGFVRNVESGRQLWGAVNGESSGVYLDVKTEDGIVTVHLGPEWFVNSQDMKIGNTSYIEVTGYESQGVIIAVEVTKGHDLLAMQNEIGCPLWARAE